MHHPDLVPKTSHLKTFAVGLALLISVGINIALAIKLYAVDLDQVCTRHTTLNCTKPSLWYLFKLYLTISVGSPILEKPMTYSDVRFNGSLFASEIYRQPPSPEVDQKWLDLGLNREFFFASHPRSCTTY